MIVFCCVLPASNKVRDDEDVFKPLYKSDKTDRKSIRGILIVKIGNETYRTQPED